MFDKKLWRRLNRKHINKLARKLYHKRKEDWKAKIENFCIDCKKRLSSYRAIRCRTCDNIDRTKRGIYPHGKNRYNFKGIKSNGRGYILEYAPNHPNARQKCVMQHRLNMESKINRYLTDKEVVHHINFIKNDNRLKNLYLFSSQKEHSQSLSSLYKIIDNLLINNIIEFKRGIYPFKK